MTAEEILRQLEQGATLEGPPWTEPVRVLTAKARGTKIEVQAVGLRTKRLWTKLLKAEEFGEAVKITLAGQLAALNGNPTHFRLAAEAHRIRLAFQYDPHFAVSVSQVDPLPHQMDVPRPLVDKDRNEPKFVWARRVLTELGESENGRLLQRKVLTALCQLRNVPDPMVSDRDAALDAIRNLKALALEHDLVSKEEARTVSEKASKAKANQQIVQERAEKLTKLRKTFFDAVVNPDRQAAGYSLQDLLHDLFHLFEIDYRNSFRTQNNTQEIDGHFFFQSFDYLLEAKWRKDQPTGGEIGAFKHKIEGKLQGTRGMFVSVPGFRKEVVEKFDEHGSSILLMDGTDLTHILEGRVDLQDGLRSKIEAAAQKGVVLWPVFH